MEVGTTPLLLLFMMLPRDTKALTQHLEHGRVSALSDELSFGLHILILLMLSFNFFLLI